jgi:hypothetical protein
MHDTSVGAVTNLTSNRYFRHLRQSVTVQSAHHSGLPSPNLSLRASAALVARGAPPHAFGVFVVTEAEATAIRSAFDQGGEFAAAVELRRLFPGITDNAEAMNCARTIASWKPLPVRPRPLPDPTPR